MLINPRFKWLESKRKKEKERERERNKTLLILYWFSTGTSFLLVPPAPAPTWAIDQGAFMQITPETASWFLLRLLFLLYICLCFSLSFSLSLFLSSFSSIIHQMRACTTRKLWRTIIRQTTYWSKASANIQATSASVTQTLASGHWS